jgi:tRNA/tmRNA/rRNA uracil-C5-methylase (TrmA/RlmC/RlmD family)
VLELYAGVGLLTVALAADGARVTAVEANSSACSDARANTAGLDVTVVQADAGRNLGLSDRVDAVVLDPPRRGAGPDVMAWIAALEPQRVIYVSCDPATFARDARVLVDHGFALGQVVGVDQFTHTAHVELVAAFSAAGRADKHGR